MAKYAVELRDQYGRLITTFAKPMNKKFDVYRNRAGHCQFTLDLYDPQATPANLAINVNDIVFRRMGVPVFAGQISYVQPTVDEDKKTVDVIATGYFDLMDYRVITPDFPNYNLYHNKIAFSSVDIGQIAWDLIDYSQFPHVSDGSACCNGVTSLEQSFIASGTSQLKTLKLLLYNSGVTAGVNFTVSLINDLGGQPRGTVVPYSTVSVNVNALPIALEWYTIDYSATTVSLTNGSTYWIKITLDVPQVSTNGVYWTYLTGNMYPSGFATSLEQPALFTTDTDLQFFVQLKDNSWQMTKNTFFGFQQGNITPSFVLSPVFDVYKQLKGGIEDMANTYNGIDYSISVQIDTSTNLMTKYFNVYYPKQGVDNTALNFTYPGNIKKINKPKDSKTLWNEIIMRGQGFGVAQLVQTVRDPISIQTYSMRQGVMQEADVTDTGTLTSLGNELIRVRKDPLDLPEIVLDGNKPPVFGSYGVGDTIKVSVIGPPMLTFASTYRIERISSSVDDDDQEEIALTVSVA